MNDIEILQNVTVDGLIVKLPAVELDRLQHDRITQRMNGIGGRWKGGKTEGFVFKNDPVPLLKQIQRGQVIKINGQNQIIELSQEEVEKIILLAEIFEDDKVLVPTAGNGALIDAVHKIHPEMDVDYCELMPENQSMLKHIKNARLVADNILNYEPTSLYDIILANPPCRGNQDIDHIRCMYKMLNPGGRIVSKASKHWEIFDYKEKEKNFKLWLLNHDAQVIDLSKSLFKKASTSIPACIIVLNKPV